MTAADRDRVVELLAALDVYRSARRTLLTALQLPESNRDPMAEWSEHLVSAILDGTLAASRVQADHDVVLADGDKVQVRYLANPAGKWVNEHRVYQIPNVEYYALVIFEAMRVTGVVVFATSRLTEVCVALGKRHRDQSAQLLITRRNWLTIRHELQRFRRLGVEVWLPPSCVVVE